MKGVPLRLEIGPKDIENNQCVLVRRDNREKTIVPAGCSWRQKIPELLEAVHDGLYQQCPARTGRTVPGTATTYGGDRSAWPTTKSGFIKTMWCGDLECEMKP